MLESMKPRLKTSDGVIQALCKADASIATSQAPNATVTACTSSNMVLKFELLCQLSK